MITNRMKNALRKQCKSYGNGDWLVGRLRLLNKLEACAESGKVGVFISGRDCDGMFFEKSYTINASVMGYVKFKRDYIYWSDGTQNFYLQKPSELQQHMQLIYNGKKWVLYGDDGKVIVITRIKSICERMMNDAK